MELVYGMHAVDALLRGSPAQVQVLFVQAGRRDKRMGAVVDLARNQGVAVVELGRYELDAKVPGRHQGVVAQVEVLEGGDEDVEDGVGGVGEGDVKGGENADGANGDGSGESVKGVGVGNVGGIKSAGGVGVKGSSGVRSVADVKGAGGGSAGNIGSVEGARGGHWDESRLYRTLDSFSDPPLLLILDGVTDPHNLGACLRSAAAAGVNAVIAPRDRAVGITPTVRKVACGAAETMPFVQVTNLARTLAALKQRGVWVYGATAEAAQSLYGTDLRGPLALVLGAEGGGLRRLTKETCDVLVSLPMAGSVGSLNVSVAAGVCLFEVVRQRALSA